MLASLAAQLHQSLGILQKQDIQTASRALRDQTAWAADSILLGDDCAAIPDGDGYLLFAAEGMLPKLVESDPWFAGWSAVMVNVSDIYAMGGHPIAVVDALWSQSHNTEAIWQGMKAAAQTYNVPIVGGHTNCHSPYNALAVAILGRAKQLIASFNARPGDSLLLATDFRGKPHPHYPFWNAATNADPIQLRQNLAILPYLAEMGWCNTGKDISNGGLIGTLLMLLETSGCGAVLNIDRIPCPTELPLNRWLVSFPSFGFLLSVHPDRVQTVQSCFQQQQLVCEVIGEMQSTPQLILRSSQQDKDFSDRETSNQDLSDQETVVFWDFSQQKLTGFSNPALQR